MRSPFSNPVLLTLAIVSFFGFPLVNGVILYRAFGQPAAGVILGGGLGLLAGFCAIPLLGVLAKMSDARTIALAARGQAPRDGQHSAVSGTIEPRGDLLQGPVSGRPCVAYHWEARGDRINSEGRRSGEAMLAESLVLAPCEIVTPNGAFELIGPAEMEAFPPREKMAQPTGVIATQLGKPRSVLRERLDDGTFVEVYRTHFTWKWGDTLKLVERVVVPGEQVTAVGRFSAEKRALVGSKNAPLGLRPGGLETPSGDSFGRLALYAFLFALGLVLVEAITWWIAVRAQGD